MKLKIIFLFGFVAFATATPDTPPPIPPVVVPHGVPPVPAVPAALKEDIPVPPVPIVPVVDKVVEGDAASSNDFIKLYSHDPSSGIYRTEKGEYVRLFRVLNPTGEPIPEVVPLIPTLRRLPMPLQRSALPAPMMKARSGMGKSTSSPARFLFDNYMDPYSNYMYSGMYPGMYSGMYTYPYTYPYNYNYSYNYGYK